jgi:hypothetical protein
MLKQTISTVTSAAIGGGAIILILAHPVSGAMIGGSLIGVNTYYLMKKFLTPKKEPPKS